MHDFKRVSRVETTYTLVRENGCCYYTDKKTFDAFMAAPLQMGEGHCVRLKFFRYSWGRFATMDDAPPFNYRYCALK